MIVSGEKIGSLTSGSLFLFLQPERATDKMRADKSVINFFIGILWNNRPQNRTTFIKSIIKNEEF